MKSANFYHMESGTLFCCFHMLEKYSSLYRLNSSILFHLDPGALFRCFHVIDKSGVFYRLDSDAFFHYFQVIDKYSFLFCLDFHMLDKYSFLLRLESDIFYPLDSGALFRCFHMLDKSSGLYILKSSALYRFFHILDESIVLYWFGFESLNFCLFDESFFCCSCNSHFQFCYFFIFFFKQSPSIIQTYFRIPKRLQTPPYPSWPRPVFTLSFHTIIQHLRMHKYSPYQTESAWYKQTPSRSLAPVCTLSFSWLHTAFTFSWIHRAFTWSLAPPYPPGTCSN